MFPQDIYERPVWCLYDDTTGNTKLIHPYRRDQVVPCPHCGKPLGLVNYKATCCGHEFKTGFGTLSRKEPMGMHNRTHGRGWASVRPAPAELLGRGWEAGDAADEAEEPGLFGAT